MSHVDFLATVDFTLFKANQNESGRRPSKPRVVEMEKCKPYMDAKSAFPMSSFFFCQMKEEEEWEVYHPCQYWKQFAQFFLFSIFTT
jgi:hypothetical protein